MQLSSLGVAHLGCLLSIHYHRNEMWPLQPKPQVRTNMALKLLDVLCVTIICMNMWKESDCSFTSFWHNRDYKKRRKPRTRMYGDKPGCGGKYSICQPHSIFCDLWRVNGHTGVGLCCFESLLFWTMPKNSYNTNGHLGHRNFKTDMCSSSWK